jgi:hypothetical protein
MLIGDQEITMAAVDPEINKLIYRIKAFNIFALVYFVSFILLIALSVSEQASNLSTFVVLAIFVSALMFNIYLGLLASSTQSSVITWVGLNIIFSPFSYLYTFPNMLSKAKQKLSELVDIKQSYEY